MPCLHVALCQPPPLLIEVEQRLRRKHRLWPPLLGHCLGQLNAPPRACPVASVGVVLSGVFVIGSILLWTFSYIFRVFTKNMTYSTQLKQYEDAVIAKRFEELQDDEVEALLGEIEREGDL